MILHLCSLQDPKTTVHSCYGGYTNQLPHTTSNQLLFSARAEPVPTALPHMPCPSCCLWPSWITLQTPRAQTQLPQTALGHLSHTLKADAPWTYCLPPGLHLKSLSRSWQGSHLHNPSILCQTLHSPSAPQHHSCQPLWCSGTTVLQSFRMSTIGNNLYFPKKACVPTTRAILSSTQIINCMWDHHAYNMPEKCKRCNFLLSHIHTQTEFSLVAQVRAPQALGLSCWTSSTGNLALHTRGTHYSWCHNHKCSSADTQNSLHLFC